MCRSSAFFFGTYSMGIQCCFSVLRRRTCSCLSQHNCILSSSPATCYPSPPFLLFLLFLLLFLFLRWSLLSLLSSSQYFISSFSLLFGIFSLTPCFYASSCLSVFTLLMARYCFLSLFLVIFVLFSLFHLLSFIFILPTYDIMLFSLYFYLYDLFLFFPFSPYDPNAF